MDEERILYVEIAIHTQWTVAIAIAIREFSDEKENKKMGRSRAKLRKRFATM